MLISEAKTEPIEEAAASYSVRARYALPLSAEARLGTLFPGNRPRLIWSIAIVVMLVLLVPGLALGEADAEPCPEGGTASVWISPKTPVIGERLKLMVVSVDGPVNELKAIAPGGEELSLSVDRWGGPPWSAAFSIDRLVPGVYRIEARRPGEAIVCRRVTVGENAKAGSARPEVEWDLRHEALYAAWIERLFDAPVDEYPTYPSLEPILRDPERNFLHGYLGLGEDEKLPATPDCADLPYLLRAYFAWKLGLPVAFRACDRGTSNRPPRCGAVIVDQRFSAKPAPVSAFTELSRRLINTVHSGNMRTSLEDDNTDFYPVALERENLWPGTIYADPYGHVLVVAKWVPQTEDRGGLLLAVDAQPDNSVGRKRFWEGTFLFADGVKNAGQGFKAFRPLARDGRNAPRLLNNLELTKQPVVAPYSVEQADLSAEDFYARMTRLINPLGLDAEKAYDAVLDALVEQLETRVHAVENGEKFMRQHPRTVIQMPKGYSIFETVGPWEDYATPSRDMRLLIAMEVLTRFPERIVRHPELFALAERSPETVREEIERRHLARTQERQIAYIRSDGSTWRLPVADILARRSAFEVAYNPNDCPEFRWGASPGMDEYATCKRRAPAGQRNRMEQYRHWFRETRRPPR
ncbi:hypothetical protein [Methylocaldum szegediense]|uniref:Uncharacterized protein n=1 Tax=Methylocaldum szegediense TaxID=73780 RepID=A0ABM9I1H2_9GAMM|nr:hypothetical protein [Methylocaldum szegediense]CAI8826825.1 conserved protein of unknown function [Methylocaldum szegediense]